jgi:Phosphotransferase enzyme family
MAFLLSSQNVRNYLVEHNICSQEEEATADIEPKYAKNFNLLLTWPQGRKLLVKQERRYLDGQTAGEFLREWSIQEFIEEFPEMEQIRSWISEAIYFDNRESIIVFNYLNDYRDLNDFYGKDNIFPTEIPETIAKILATIHRLTLDRQDYQDFFAQKHEQSLTPAIHLVENLERIGPEIFASVPADGLKFFALYQRYDSLGQAIAELGNSFTPCCLTHNDLKLNNILLSNHWQEEQSLSKGDMLRFIDWERCSWGDPALDLGTLIGSYLVIWLTSLITSKTMTIDESLRMATTPLEQLQPTLAALVIAYLNHFPEILEHRPDFLQRVVQFSGLNLIHTIESILQYQKSFGNMGISMLQVAKSLLCRPETSMRTIFGMEASEILHRTNQLKIRT